MKLRKPRKLLLSAAAAAMLYLSANLWLPVFGSVLVVHEAPSRADAAVVLAGDGFGLRILKGGELVRAGVVPVALISGPRVNYDHDESDLAIEFAERRGYPRTYFAPVPNLSTSTEDEATMMLEEVRRRGYRRIVVVTSDFHTARAARIWRRQAGPDIAVQIAAAPDHDFIADRWWHNRESRKKTFFEWVKTVTGPLGL